MLGILWRLLRGYGGDEKDGGWLRKRPDARIVEWQDLERGRRIVVSDGTEQRTYLTDALGNVEAVLR